MLPSKFKWNGKSVLITGVNGFVGGNLAKVLIQQKAKVFGLMRNEKKDTLLFFEELAPKLNIIRGDLCDKDLMSRIISEEQISVIFHLASQVEVGVGITNPYLTFETNIRGTYTLLEAARQYSSHLEAIIVASTDKSYGSYKKEEMPYKEHYPLKPKYPYDTSKACADMISQVYASDLYKMPMVITRFCNIYGPGQLNFSAIVPDAITSALGFSQFIPRGDGTMVRDFIYVEDVAELYLKIAESLACSPEKIAGEIFNAGTNSPISMKEILQKIYSLIGNKKDFEEVLKLMEGKKTRGEIDYQYMDFEKVNQYFGWKPKHTIDEGLKKTIEWFKSYHLFNRR